MPAGPFRLAFVLMLVALSWSTCPAADARHPGHDVVWSQLPTTDEMYLGYSSTQLPDQAFFSESVADFEPSESCEIVHVHWWGTGL